MIILPGAHAYDRVIDGLPPVECHNMYAERVPSDVGAEWVLTQVPGEINFATFEAGGTVFNPSEPRGLFSTYGVFDGDIFSVIGNRFERTNNAGNRVFREIDDDLGTTGYSYFATVRGYVAFTAEGSAWVYNGFDLQQVTLPTGAPIADVAAIDGRFYYMEEGSDRIWWSGIFDPLNIDPLAFATAETHEDQLVRIVEDHREVWLFGQETIEVWRPVADFEQPLQRVGDYVLQKGTLSPQSVVALDNTIFWVGNDAMVYKAAGAAFQRVSNHGIDRELSLLTLEQLALVNAFTYTEDGHIFYVLTIPDGRTYVYDASTGAWHTRGRELNIGWGATHAAEAFSRTYVLSFGTLRELTRDSVTIDGVPIVPVVSGNLPAAYPSLVQRVGLTCAALTVDGSEIPDAAVIAFSFSDDSGRTYSAEENIRIHQQGAFGQRVQAYRQGQLRSPGRTYRFRGLNPNGTTRYMIGPLYVNEPLH